LNTGTEAAPRKKGAASV